MTRIEAMQLSISLSDKGLKVKHLSATEYASLIELRRPIMKYLNEMSENEITLAKEMDISQDQDGNFDSKDKGFLDKLKLIQAKEFTPKELNFIPMDTFKKFTDEVDFSTGAILSDWLLTK